MGDTVEVPANEAQTEMIIDGEKLSAEVLIFEPPGDDTKAGIEFETEDGREGTIILPKADARMIVNQSITSDPGRAAMLE